jgi:hypothetical protein
LQCEESVGSLADCLLKYTLKILPGISKLQGLKLDTQFLYHTLHLRELPSVVWSFYVHEDAHAGDFWKGLLKHLQPLPSQRRRKEA